VLHVSTRGEAPALSFTDALLTGLARDGGLYVPQSWPALPRDAIAAFAGRPYAVVAQTVMRALVDGEIAAPDLGRMVDDA
jgi:threonine synthase